MNFPVGNVIAKGNAPFDFKEVADALVQKKFNGYFILSVKGECIEDGAIFFRDGEMVACIVECSALGKTIRSREASEYFFNETMGEGFFQIVELARSQVDLVTAFDEKILFVDKITLKDLPKLIPNAFEAKFVSPKQGEHPMDLYGLGELKN